ncbi:MAG: hypothetical protein PHC28_11720 [Flavobacterium sp.]|uniref:hypothetical protein n=1 Tax=Flavobacterium sp. TaxID=239 RepID=UPI00262EDAC4|nr:hypothetical protein [Flavobacterium sp.]MDD5151121.1 hypothetical protein [Flavobacterium sp.]
MKEYRINNITDLLELTEEEFERMLPDLRAWYNMSRQVQQKSPIRVRSFIWVDDNNPGNLKEIRVIS